MTRQRAIILEVIRSDAAHHTAEEIYFLSKEKLPTISKATVYNNLKAMDEEGLIRKISGEGSSDRYDKNRIPHGHIFCKDCGGIYDIHVPHIGEQIEDENSVTVLEYELKVFGSCDKCRQN